MGTASPFGHNRSLRDPKKKKKKFVPFSFFLLLLPLLLLLLLLFPLLILNCYPGDDIAKSGTFLLAGTGSGQPGGGSVEER